MPLYTITTQAHSLTDAAKASLATRLTTLHSGYANVPRNWFHVIFHDYQAGSGLAAVSRLGPSS
jgi:phenylpyruvate tautomerase PptA (4-oxalocrotonate tautomerase family)